jgi:hypothetical protein
MGPGEEAVIGFPRQFQFTATNLLDPGGNLEWAPVDYGNNKVTLAIRQKA